MAKQKQINNEGTRRVHEWEKPGMRSNLSEKEFPGISRKEYDVYSDL